MHTDVTQDELDRRWRADLVKIQTLNSQLLDRMIEQNERERRWGIFAPILFVGGPFLAGGAFVAASLGIAKWLLK